MKKLFTITSALLFGITLTAQQWVQTGSTPEGGGVTQLIVLPESNDIFVTTVSFNWPNGQDGGIRRSTDDGDTWDNVFDAFSGLTITAGSDGNLYASVWPFPDDEGLYRSTDNGDTWDLLATMPSGNNFFSITVSTVTNPTTIFAGTRTGVYRSTDNGNTWAFSNSGMQVDSWVKDIEVDPFGVVAAGTSSGLYISEDNGTTWEKATGGGIGDKTITALNFDASSNKMGGGTTLYSGTSDGSLFASFDDPDNSYLVAVLAALFGNDELTKSLTIPLEIANRRLHGVTTFPAGPGNQSGFYFIDGIEIIIGGEWTKENSGLPDEESPEISALDATSNDTEINFVMGLFENYMDGAKVFKFQLPWEDVPVGIENFGLIPNTGLILDQNIPNPFDQSTLITYHLANEGQVKLSVYASDGQLVSKLIDRHQTKGEYQVNFSADNLSEGIYYYKLETHGQSEVRKMVVLKK